MKGCVWRRGEYSRRTYAWRDWAFRGSAGIHGLKVGEGEEDDNDSVISFKPGKGVRIAGEK